MPKVLLVQSSVTLAQAQRIQATADVTRQVIYVVGSRAGGTAGADSDWDYILTGSSDQVQRAKSRLPGWGASDPMRGSTTSGRGVDIWQGGKLAPAPHERPGGGRFMPNQAFFKQLTRPGHGKAPYHPLDTTKPYLQFDPVSGDTNPRLDYHPNKGGARPSPVVGEAFTITFRT